MFTVCFQEMKISLVGWFVLFEKKVDDFSLKNTKTHRSEETAPDTSTEFSLRVPT